MTDRAAASRLVETWCNPLSSLPPPFQLDYFAGPAVEEAYRLLQILRRGVRVVARHPNSRVPQQVAQREGVYSRLQARGDRVPQVVKPQVLDPGLPARALERPLDLRQVHARARTGEDEPVTSSVLFEPEQLAPHLIVHRDESRLAALAVRDEQVVRLDLDLLAPYGEEDRERAEVDVLPAHSKYLSSPHAGVQSDDHHRPDVRPPPCKGVHQPLLLLVGEIALSPPTLTELPHPANGIRLHQPVVERHREDLREQLKFTIDGRGAALGMPYRRRIEAVSLELLDQHRRDVAELLTREVAAERATPELVVLPTPLLGLGPRQVDLLDELGEVVSAGCPAVLPIEDLLAQLGLDLLRLCFGARLRQRTFDALAPDHELHSPDATLTSFIDWHVCSFR